MIISYTGPAVNRLQTCYRPIFIAATATGLPKVTYCDIYVEGDFYVTLTATYPTKVLAATSVFQFDLSGALQPLFSINVPAASTSSLIRAENCAKKVFCRLRSSEINAQGFLVPDGPIPIQGVDKEPPYSLGGGLEMDPFWIVPYCLQEADGPSLAVKLISNRVGQWAAGYFPMTNRPGSNRVGHLENDFFPFIKTTAGDSLVAVEIHYLRKGQSVWEQEVIPETAITGTGVFLITSGPAQIEAFTGLSMSTVDRYFLKVVNSEMQIVASSPLYKVQRSCEDDIRLLFQNYAGTLDGVSLTVRNILREVASDVYVLRTGGRGRRSNIESKEVITALTAEYDEAEQPWLMELLESPLVWVQTPAGYTEMVVQAAKLPTQKEAERYSYEFVINLIPSRSRSSQRG